MPACMVLGCTSGYRSNKEKSHFFNVPRDSKALELWKKAIGRTDISIKSGQSVCNKHFRQDEVLWRRELRGPDGAVVGVSPYKIPRLVKGAIPSIFAWTECTKLEPSAIVENVSHWERDSSEAMDCSDNQLSDAAIPVTEVIKEENVAVNCMNDFPMELHAESSHEPVALLTIQELIESNLSLVPGWLKQNMRRDDMTSVVFCKLDYCRGIDVLKTFPLKEVIVTSDMSVQVNILSQSLSITDLPIELSPVLTIEQLQALLLQLDELKVCTGSKVQKELEKIDCRVVNKDVSGTWRHVKCSLLLSNTTICKFCQRVKKTAARKIRRTEIRGEPKRIRLQLSSNNKQKLLQLQTKLNSTQKATRRAKKSILTLKSHLDACQEQLNSYNKKSLEGLVETAKFPMNQAHALKEIVAGAKLKDSKGRRYPEEWILLCMLLHMRSASAYNFFRVNNILPLPCPRTIQRYLSNFNTPCGFNDEFFEALKLALSKKENIKTHGILRLDEIATRDSSSVDTKLQMYKGLVDFKLESEQTSEFTDKANNGLVIVFHPLFDDYTQPIAVFTSRTPVKGHGLAQLLVKAIVLLENVGARVHGVVTDGASPNRKFWSELGIIGSRKHFKNYFEHPSFEDRRVFIFSHTSHLIKTIRNRLYNSKILRMGPNKPFIRWKHFETLHEKDKALAGPGHALVCPKLTKHHLVPSNSQKMRVKLAVQVFSNSVASGLRLYQRYDPMLNDCEGTAWFCDWINKMFDALNRKQPVDGVQPGDHDFKVIQESIKTLDTWEENAENGLISEELFLIKQTAENLRVTLQSTLDIVKYLTQHCGFTSVLTGRINQDPVEVRSSEGLPQGQQRD